MDEYKKFIRKRMTDTSGRGKVDWTEDHVIIAVHCTYKNPSIGRSYLYYKSSDLPKLWTRDPHDRKSAMIGRGQPRTYLQYVGDGKTKWIFWAIKKSDIDKYSEYTFFIADLQDTEKNNFNGTYYGGGRTFSRTFNYISENNSIKRKIRKAISMDQIKIVLENYSIVQKPATNDPKLSMSHTIKISILFDKDVGLEEKYALFYIQVHPQIDYATRGDWSKDIQADWSANTTVEIPFRKKAILTFEVPPGYTAVPYKNIKVEVSRDYKYKGFTMNSFITRAEFESKVNIKPTIVIE